MKAGHSMNARLQAARYAASHGLLRAMSLIVLFTLAGTPVFGDFLWFKTRNPARDIGKIVRRQEV